MKSPSDAIIALTHRCNAHCIMCNVWKSKAADALAPEHMSKLPTGLKTINLTGGEPFLRDDLPQFIGCVRDRCPRAQITISTNGYMPERTREMMDQIVRIDPSVRLAVSLDGIGQAHDAVRGDEGAFDSVMKLIETMKNCPFSGLRLSMTLTSRNYDQLLPVADLAAELCLELGIVAAHEAKTHLGVEHLPHDPNFSVPREAFGNFIAAGLRSFTPKKWLRAHFANFTYRYIISQPWKIHCRSGRDFFFLQADGIVYNCSVAGHAMGNIITQNWDEIWTGEAADKARNFAASCRANCWMICTARSIYRRRAIAVIWWIFTRKILAHLGMLGLSMKKVEKLEKNENTPH